MKKLLLVLVVLCLCGGCRTHQKKKSDCIEYPLPPVTHTVR